jgi:hypothetical protein
MRLDSLKLWLPVLALVLFTQQADAQVVPGTGTRVTQFGDDFEAEDWQFVHNHPKSSKDIDEQVREPAAYSVNMHWGEGLKRGQPDHIQRIPTPEGGLPGSQGALCLASLYTGRPNRPSYTMQQDDLVVRTDGLGMIPVSYTPNVVVRVYFPPFDQWENATGSTFGYRASVVAEVPAKAKPRGFFRRRSSGTELETYYPGFFVQFNSSSDGRNETDSAVFVVRGDSYGRDFHGPTITEGGCWWTLGMTFTGDGRVHYYASPGVDDLTSADHIGSHFPQGVKCLQFKTVFFNIVNRDNGRDWSTEWIIDDPELYLVNGGLQYASGTSSTYRR